MKEIFVEKHNNNKNVDNTLNMGKIQNCKTVLTNRYSEKERLDKFIKNAINHLKLIEQSQKEFESYSGVEFLKATDHDLENYIIEHFSQIQSIFIQSILGHIRSINYKYNNVILNIQEYEDKITFKIYASKFDIIISLIEHIKDKISINAYCFEDEKSKDFGIILFNILV
jgi:hypothetical protein